MALITRLSRLFHADINAVLDRIEEPELLLKQAIREMEETLFNHEKQIKLLALEQQKLLDQEEGFKQSLVDLDEQLKVCFELDKDELAQSVIKRKLETTFHLKTLIKKISNAANNIQHVKAQFKEHQTQLNDLKQNVGFITQSDTVPNVCNTHSATIQDEEIKVAFLQEKQKWSQS